MIGIENPFRHLEKARWLKHFTVESGSLLLRAGHTVRSTREQTERATLTMKHTADLRGVMLLPTYPQNKRIEISIPKKGASGVFDVKHHPPPGSRSSPPLLNGVILRPPQPCPQDDPQGNYLEE